MSGKVIQFPGSISPELDLDPNKVLSSAQTQQLSDVLVLGYDADGNLYSASSSGQATLVLFMLEQAKLMLLNQFVVEE